MSQPHKHAYYIKAWADGGEVEYFDDMEKAWHPVTLNTTWFEDREYRIKPKKPRDISMKIYVESNGTMYPTLSNANLKVTFDGITHELIKAEVL